MLIADQVRWMKEHFPDLHKNTLHAISPSGGEHYYFTESNLSVLACVIKDDPTVKIDTRGVGGYIVSPFHRSSTKEAVKAQTPIEERLQKTRCVQCNDDCSIATGAYQFTNLLKPISVPPALQEKILKKGGKKIQNGAMHQTVTPNIIWKEEELKELTDEICRVVSITWFNGMTSNRNTS